MCVPSSRTNKDGSKVTYVQLAHNVCGPKARRAKAEVADVALGNPEPIALQHLYRAMDALLTHRPLGGYLRQQKSGALVIDRKKIREEAHLGGKYTLSTSDEVSPRKMWPWATNSSSTRWSGPSGPSRPPFELRPLYHHKDDRIASHVFICFLALLLVRIAERKTGFTWDRIRTAMEPLHLGEFSSKDGRLPQCTEPTAE